MIARGRSTPAPRPAVARGGEASGTGRGWWAGAPEATPDATQTRGAGPRAGSAGLGLASAGAPRSLPGRGLGAARAAAAASPPAPASATPYRIGTRGSPLALWQAHETARLLRERFPEHFADEGSIEIVITQTTGDAIQDRPLADIGGKGLFTRELDAALLERRIDCAVHSLKDVPTYLPEGVHLAAFLPREDNRDALIFPDVGTPPPAAAPAPGGRPPIPSTPDALRLLPPNARVGTSSLRRASQVLRARPDVEVVPLRGNVQTRLGKLRQGECDATLLALAGLARLGMERHASHVLGPDEMLPAVAQGIIGVTTSPLGRGDPRDELVAALNDRPSALAAACERAFLAALDGSCRTPIAGHARLTAPGRRLEFRGLVAALDGSSVAETQGECDANAEAASELGDRLGRELKARAPQGLFEW